MTRHFNVGEAKAQLSKLIDAAVRGEESVQARAKLDGLKVSKLR